MITIVREGGGGQRVMLEIIISVNDENDGRPLIQFRCVHIVFFGQWDHKFLAWGLGI